LSRHFFRGSVKYVLNFQVFSVKNYFGMKSNKDLTAKEIAEMHNVQKRVAQGWIQRGYFPNAYKEDLPIAGEIWRVPVKDLEDFNPPRAGRPLLKNPKASTLAKRQYRANKGEKAA
jgi:hypothetical protein